MTMNTYLVLGTALTLGLIATQGCTVKALDPLHCANNDGDAYCREQFDDGLTRYCQRGTDECSTPDGEYGCVLERPADECYSPCGGRQTIDENGECIMVEDSSTGSSTGGTDTESSGSSESSTTGPMPCMGNADCPDSAAPFCEPLSGECVACDATKDPDGACMELDSTKPVCVDGSCVACTPENPAACVDTTPICDGATNTCVSCTAHEQCGEAACNLFTGACLPADRVVHVGGATADFDDLSSAVMSFGPETEGTIIVHAGPSYDESVTVGGGRVIALLAADDAAMPPQWIQSSAGSGPQLTVAAGTTVLIDGLRMSGNPDDVGVHLTGGQAWVDRSRIIQNIGGGILAGSNAELVLRNCFVGGNVEANVLELQGANAGILYTTLGAGLGVTTSITCDAPSMVTVRNSLIVSRSDDNEIACANLDATYTATEALLDGMGNVALGAMDVTWFGGFNAGDFLLSATHPATIDTTARWLTDDPSTDIDGDPRPIDDASPDYAGADVP